MRGRVVAGRAGAEDRLMAGARMPPLVRMLLSSSLVLAIVAPVPAQGRQAAAPPPAGRAGQDGPTRPGPDPAVAPGPSRGTTD